MPTALITGANRGLGLETAKQLAARGYDVVLTARSLDQAREAVRELRGPGRFEPAQLDVTDDQSVARLSRELVLRGLTKIDALINNAGTTMHGFDAEVARRTLDANYRGAVRVTDALLPLLSGNAKIVMVSSGMGELSSFDEPVRARLTDPVLDRKDIEALAEEFVTKVAQGKHEQAGFPSNAYAVSKALLNAFTRVLSRELVGSERRVNAVCPGWVRTRMGGQGASRSVEEGARGIVWAATLAADGPRGGFFRDGHAIEW